MQQKCSDDMLAALLVDVCHIHPTSCHRYLSSFLEGSYSVHRKEICGLQDTMILLICRDKWEKTLIFDITIGKAIQRLFSWRWLDRSPNLWKLYVWATGVALVMSTSSYQVRRSRPFSENSHWPVFKGSYWQCHAAEFKWKKIHYLPCPRIVYSNHRVSHYQIMNVEWASG